MGLLRKMKEKILALQKKPEGKDSGSKDTHQPTDITKCSAQGCLTVTLSCYCDGALADDSECSFSKLPTNQTLECTLDCDDCEWINLSEWSPCVNHTQFLTRECSCEDKLSSDLSSDKSSAYSSFCNGYTQIFRSCQTTIASLSVEDWKSSPWPLKADTQFRTFKCSSLTWFDLLQKSSLDPWETLAVEVIVCHLNLLSGVSPSDKLLEDLASAEKLLLNCNWSEAQKSGEEEKDLLDALRDFNQFNPEKINNINTAEGDDIEAKEKSNANDPQLLFMILIPGVLLVIAIIVLAVFFIKRRAADKNSVSL